MLKRSFLLEIPKSELRNQRVTADTQFYLEIRALKKWLRGHLVELIITVICESKIYEVILYSQKCKLWKWRWKVSSSVLRLLCENNRKVSNEKKPFVLSNEAISFITWESNYDALLEPALVRSFVRPSFIWKGIFESQKTRKKSEKFTLIHFCLKVR